MSTMRRIRWTSIELLHTVRRDLQGALDSGVIDALPVVQYRAKVKLHGSNGAVQIHPDGTIVPQGRNRLLTREDHNARFAIWVHDNREAFAPLAVADRVVVLYGEWAGPGIQKGVAVTRVDRRFFAVFAVQLIDPSDDEATPTLVVAPERIRALVPDHPDLFVLPWHGPVFRLDFADVDQLRAEAERISEAVQEVEARDPWVAETFGIDGGGEGLVLYPVPEGAANFGARPRKDITRLMFKAKGDKHKVVRTRKTVQIDPEVVAGIEAFVTLFLTEQRLEQGLREVFGDEPPTHRGIGPFLKWFGQDVKRESVAELEAADLTWKQVGKAIGRQARSWLLERIERL